MAKIRSTMVLTFGLFFVLLGTLAAQGRDRDEGEFVILSAQYATDHRHVDVTHRLRELARSDRQFRVDANTIDADPAPGRAKMLRVFARGPNGQEQSFDFSDGSAFDGAQFRGWGRGDWGDEHWNGGWNGRGEDAQRHEEPAQHHQEKYRGSRGLLIPSAAIADGPQH